MHNQLMQQQQQQQRQQELQSTAQHLINDAYLNQERIAKQRHRADAEQAQRLLEKAFPLSDDLSSVTSPREHSINTDPGPSGRTSGKGPRPKTALDRLLSEGSVSGLPRSHGPISGMPSTNITSNGSPRPAWQSSSPAQAPSASPPPPGPSQHILAAMSEDEKRLLLQAIREELHVMQNSNIEYLW